MDTDLPFLDDDIRVLEIDMYSLASLQSTRQQQPRLTMKVDYMASRLRAALLAWADSDTPTQENVAWWCRGLSYELVSPIYFMSLMYSLIFRPPQWLWLAM